FSFGGKRETRRSHSYSRRPARLAVTHSIKEDGGTVETVPYGDNLKIEHGATRATVPYRCIDENQAGKPRRNAAN
ncbi:MAG: hypothetical protein RSF84_09210, partial [Ruthenibacterium sp.]